MIKAVTFDMFETLVTPYRSTLYFGEHIAKDMNISEVKFREIWDSTEEARTCGQLTFEDAIRNIMQVNGVFSDEKFKNIIDKRIQCKREVFTTYSQSIITMLDILKARSIKIALISNCYSEEVDVIKNSPLFCYFDVAMLSFEQGVKKPDPEIYYRALKGLGIEAAECLYVGDGGSHELDAALEVGMKPLQAKWYLKENSRINRQIYKQYDGLDDPEALFIYL